MKYKVLHLAFIAFCNCVFGQIDESKEFVYLFSRSLVYGKNVSLNTGMLGPVIYIDGKKLEPEIVKFYQNEKGFFANIRDRSALGNSDFYKCVSRGKINYFREMEYFYTLAKHEIVPEKYWGKGFYNKDFGDLKIVNYENLHADLKDNPLSIIQLNRYKSNETTQKGLHIAGFATILSGIVTQIIKSNRKHEPKIDQSGVSAPPRKAFSLPGAIMIGSGISCFAISYSISNSKPKHIKRAIDAYNK